MPDLNTVAVTGNLTSDAELRGENQTVLAIRLAVTGRAKRGEEWVDVPNYFDVSLFGNRAQALAPYLKRGARIGLQGRLEWREWEQDDGQKRQAVGIVVDDLVLLGGRKDEPGPPD
jgi:single-strand DNA-binding protein